MDKPRSIWIDLAIGFAGLITLVVFMGIVIVYASPSAHMQPTMDAIELIMSK